MENNVTPAENAEVVETTPAPEKPAKKESLAKLIFTLVIKLFVITAAVALMLGGVNAITKEPIAKYAQEKRAEAMEAVLHLPGQNTWVWHEGEPVEIQVGSSKSPAIVTPMVDLLSSQHDPNGRPNAFCVEVHPSGYGGEMTLMVGIRVTMNRELEVNAVRIVSHSETSGVGSKTTNPDFLDQYEGKVVGITIGGGENSITAISGATISSKAVTAGVNEALAAANEYVNLLLAGQLPSADGITEEGGGDQ